MDCLIIDDEIELASAIAGYFCMFGITAEVCFDVSILNLEKLDCRLVLLDINLGDNAETGYSLCRKIRKVLPTTKIFFMSARNLDDDIIKAYGMGGDDYIVKPFSLSVLTAKVKHALSLNKGVERYRGLEVDDEAMKVSNNGRPVVLKNMEYKLFYYLFSNRGRIVSKDELLTRVWGDGYYTDNTLNVHINRVREKVENYPSEYIVTAWGVGYKLE